MHRNRCTYLGRLEHAGEEGAGVPGLATGYLEVATSVAVSLLAVVLAYSGCALRGVYNVSRHLDGE